MIPTRDELKRTRPVSDNGARCWADEARAAIRDAHKALPADCSFEARSAAIDAAFPFGRRAHYPYKVWCRERRRYLNRYLPGAEARGVQPKGNRP